jgi:processive 1,2-diacylglycerol beta-glucosyltransferase
VQVIHFMKKILVLYTFVGHGHKKIAENIAAALQSSFEVDLIDLMKLDGGKLASQGSKLYLAILNKTPWLWEFFYTNKIFLDLTLPLRRVVASFKSKKLAKILQEKNYDAVICAQTNASAVMSYLKKKGLFKGKLIVTFSDFHLHRYWLYDNVDFYLANVEQQKQEMAAEGIAAEKILVCGITLKPKKELDVGAIRQKFSLKPTDKVLLVLGGGIGFGFDAQLVEQLSKVEAKLFIVCGQNQEIEKEMQAKFSGKQNIKIFGYIDFMPELYAIADLVVSKPGGLTVAECLQSGLVMLVYNCLPGPETLNYKYLLANNLILPKNSAMLTVAELELHTGQFSESLKNNPLARQIAQDGSVIRDKLTEFV